MKFTQFLQKNLLWNFSKDTYNDLCCAPTTEMQLYNQLQKLSDRYFPQRRKVETAYTEFCLNDIALTVAKTSEEKCVKQHFNEYWQSFLRVKEVFDKSFMLFPSDGGRTRLEMIAELITKCTQFAVNTAEVAHICEKVREFFDLEEREARNLENIVTLYKINYFCAVAKAVFRRDPYAERKLGKMLNEKTLKTEFSQNEKLRHAYYTTDALVSNVDCLSNSATNFIKPTSIDVKPYFYVNGKNVFDTFCASKFGKRTAEFCSQSATLKVSMQYFLENSMEIRKYTVDNLGKGSKKLVTDFLFRHLNASSKATFFEVNGALCIAVEGNADFYSALAIVRNNKILPCSFEEGRLSAQFTLPQNGNVSFDVVTIYAQNMPALSKQLDLLFYYGATRCPYVSDVPSDNVINYKNSLQVSAHGYTKRTAPEKVATTLNFTYQLGNDNVGTFLDNAGNSATLINGFAFGLRGEKIFAVKNGAMAQLNCGKFTLSQDSIIYSKPNGATCILSHSDNKSYNVQYPAACKTLFYFPLEEQSTVTLENGTFTVKSKLRSFTVECLDKVESFTTNALECNNERLRYKLSDNLEAGTCLAICFATATSVRLNIASLSQIAAPCPLVRESLVSTYLNYVNGKNVFCLNNFLKRCDSLTLAAITFTNPHFVKDYVMQHYNKETFYYDVAGRRKKFYDRLALPLAIIYYAEMHGGDFPTDALKQYVNGVIFNETFTGRDLCVKALILKKAAHVKGFDKVCCLIEYNNLKKVIANDAKLYGYAQAIGAVSLTHPSKERLKDLCAKYDIPKSWYYVSQLENLYGMSLIDGALQFAPKVTQENVLEQLAVNVAGKRIDTTFAKSTVQSMTLNGTQYFVPFKPQNLKNKDNTLVVRY